MAPGCRYETEVPFSSSKPIPRQLVIPFHYWLSKWESYGGYRLILLLNEEVWLAIKEEDVNLNVNLNSRSGKGLYCCLVFPAVLGPSGLQLDV